MNDAFIAFAVYLFLCTLFGPVVALLWELLCALTGYAGLVLKTAALALARAIWLLSRAAAHGAWLAMIFLYFLISEVLSGDRGAEDADASEAPAEGDPDLYEAALTLLGLSAKFTRAELDAAFKAAIRTAHPDAGGSLDQAQAVNAARDLLLPHAV